MRQLRSQTPEQPGQGPRHAELLRAGGQCDRLDTRGNEVGAAGDRGEAEVGRYERQLAQQVPHVGLLTRPVPSEHVCVEQDHNTAS